MILIVLEYIFGSLNPSLPRLVTVVVNRRKVIQSTGFLVVRWVVEAVLGCGNFLWEWLWVAELSLGKKKEKFIGKLIRTNEERCLF